MSNKQAWLAKEKRTEVEALQEEEEERRGEQKSRDRQRGERVECRCINSSRWPPFREKREDRPVPCCCQVTTCTEVSLWAAPLARVLGTSDPPAPSEDPERVASRLILRTLRSGPQRLPPRNYSGRGHASPWVGVAVHPCRQVVRAMRVSAWGPRAGDEWCACTHATMPHLHTYVTYILRTEYTSPCPRLTYIQESGQEIRRLLRTSLST